MEGLVSPSGSLKQISSRRVSSSSSQKDLWFVTSQGTLSELETALLLLKKNGGSIDSRNTFGLTPLHLATWRNHVPIVKRLLAAGADPDARDGESGWSSLHRALHFGHLAVASILLQSGASLMLEDSKIRTPIDLLSGPVLQVNGSDLDSVTTEVFSWGSGANYQLGTGNAHIQKLPCKVDALQGLCVKVISAAKFHSVAVGAGGELYTWGFGRGGRLGHPDFDIHSGQAAVITPRQVTLGLGSRRVKAVAAAKHHTVIATESGEVFTWGSNREGQLGYTSVDTQPTPRRVSSLRSKIIAVAAANKHTAAVSESGEVFTWGCNKEGQLGYGTSNSASNYTPRVVEYLKGKVFTSVSAAKYHTIVLGADGEVFTWGHRLVTPRRVVVARNIKKYGAPLKFHRMERLHVVSIAAGMIHSTALTDDGALFYWISSDPDLRCQQLYSLCGRNIVSTSAGKYWTAAVTVTGDVYMCDGKKYKDETPIPSRLHGIKRATSVSVGETHVLVVCALYSPIYPPKSEETSQKQMFKDGDELEELDEDFMFNDMLSDRKQPTLQNDDSGKRSIPSLKSICERVAADYLVEPRNAIQLLEIADSLEADDLRKHCEEVSLRNLDYIFTVSAPAVASASLEILAKLEKSLDARSSEPWSYRRLPTSTATFPAVINDELEGTENKGCHRPRDNRVKPIMAVYEDIRADCFLQTNNAAEQAISKQIRALRKKLQQIEILELKLSNGQSLDDQQLEKLQSRSALETALAGLGFPLDSEPKHPLVLSDGKGIKKMETCRKQRRKSKQNETLVETLSAKYEVCIPQNALKGFNDAESLQDPEEKGDVDINEAGKTKTNQCSFDIPKDALNSNNSKTPRSTLSKKKNKKGGLSMFLSGALDDNQKDAPLPPPPKSEGPVWGGAINLKGPASLRDIQNEQRKTKSNLLNRGMMDQSEDLEETGSVGYIRLSSFLPGVVSSPITVVPARAVAPPEGEKSTPPWSSSGTSPVMIRTSLRDIQIQQEKKHQGIISHSPKTSTSGFVVSSSSSQGSQLESGRPKDTIPSRWFKPETDAPSSIRSIQIEEKAMKDLKRFYSTVKLVRTQPQVP